MMSPIGENNSMKLAMPVATEIWPRLALHDPSGGANNVVEIYDPATETFNSGRCIELARSDHTSTLLSTGDVLIGGGTVLSQMMRNVCALPRYTTPLPLPTSLFPCFARATLLMVRR